MPINQNPANTRLASDVKFYRRKIDNDAAVADEVREHLNKKTKNKYPKTGPSNNDIRTGEAFRDMFSFQDGKSSAKKDQDSTQIPNRLGGGLDNPMPIELERKGPGKPHGLPDPKAADSPITWTPPGPGSSAVTVDILPGDIVKHTDIVNNVPIELSDAHEYMHGIFSHILYEVRDLLEDINVALEQYAGKVSESYPATTEANDYRATVEAFDLYCANLQPGGSSPYSGTLNFAGIDPVVTNEGFIVSCRVKMNWKNPYHSSSTIRIP